MFVSVYICGLKKIKQSVHYEQTAYFSKLLLCNYAASFLKIIPILT